MRIENEKCPSLLWGFRYELNINNHSELSVSEEAKSRAFCIPVRILSNRNVLWDK